MSADELPKDVVAFDYAEDPPAPGQWSWRVIENRREPVVRCPTCGAEAYLPARYTIASDGLVASPKGKGFRCRNAPDCQVRGRWLLRDFAAHSRLPE